MDKPNAAGSAGPMGLMRCAGIPGVETPGYCRMSLGDEGWVAGGKDWPAAIHSLSVYKNSHLHREISLKCQNIVNDSVSASKLPISTTEETISTIEETFLTVEETISTIEETFSTVKESISTVEETFSTTEETFLTVEETVSTIKENISMVKETLSMVVEMPAGMKIWV